MSTQDLVGQYVATLLQQYEYRDYDDAQGKRDVRPWNRLGHQVEAAHRELKARGDEGIDAILPLIHHANPNVRYSAMVDCLRQRTTQVLPLLEQEAKTNNWFETKADFQGTLEMWNEGKWIVD